MPQATGERMPWGRSSWLAGLIPATHAGNRRLEAVRSTQEHVVVSLDDRISDYIALLGEGPKKGSICARFRGPRCRSPGSRFADSCPEHGGGKVP